MGASLSRQVCIAAGITYPAYASFKALESPRTDDADKQWLTYWVVYGACTSLETVASPLLSWLPGYYMAKMAFLMWMMLPKTKGAMIMYRKVVFPYLKKYEPYVDKKLAETQHAADKWLVVMRSMGSEIIAKQLAALQRNEALVQLLKSLTTASDQKKSK
ncbi:hypothetical protein BBJ28_00018973 [Nothophytophthora sp. Chile5]|nr:hypothetical protein BBJ28_00018973 [Nothophytophthora sp. Chile5]